ncbi:ATP-binding protein [Brevibacillus sp. NSP2.1]|uniref:BbrUII/HgiDII family restriction enzyme n=1 Tax=Brevibacillus sp. NSP2.1 TaxID=3003229 RepID=UPI00040DF2BD|nr:ATP-binding protein [Brevibacillus sp. NSP2.1]QHZ55834.1 ATP-binding protein [Brevibacillus sp. NSP2.1]
MDNKFEMTMSLNVLQHLGINLYSNIPAVLSEVVANAWDADAEEVHIHIADDKITIQDNGSGMTVDDINQKFLNVGYQKREHGNSITPKFKRKVMGRKGIGKLSLFSIAHNIEVHTCKYGVKSGFKISTDALEKKIKEGESTYFPDEIELDKIQIEKDGTLIILTDLKKRTSNAASFLRKRLARRFSIVGAEYNFQIYIDNSPIEVTDREYFHKIKHLWTYTDEEHDVDYKKYCREKLAFCDDQRPTVIEGTPYKVHGWIGAVEFSGDLKDENDNLNKIVVMVRGKLAQEDILEDFSEGGLYTKYLIGELHADFLDLDEEADIATSNRQRIIEDDPRYIYLKEFLKKELRHIANHWTKLRNEEGKDQALKIPAIKNWFSELGSDHRKKAESLFGKINQLTLDPDAKKDLFKHSVLAFESFRYKENLEQFDKISPENIQLIAKVIDNFDDIEATLYHQIVNERLKVIELLQEKVDDDALERVLQEHLYTHLWLLDPSWDRATETPYMEQSIAKEFEKVNADFSEEERKARYDIRYKKVSGKHVIIELKRASVTTNTFKLMEQVTKYRDALRKVLIETGKEYEPIEIICIVGKQLSDWTNESKREESARALASYNARVVLYKQLIDDSYNSYQSFLEVNKEAGRVSRLIQEIDNDMSHLLS